MDANYETWPVSKLVAKIYDLEATIQSLKEVNSDSLVLSIKDKFRLTLSQARLLTALSDGRPHSKRALYEFVYHDEFNNPPEMKVIDVFMSHVRKKIRPFGLSIETMHGAGYRLHNHELVPKVIAGEIDPIDVPESGETLKRKPGDNMRVVLKVLIQKMDSSGKAKIMARVLARMAGLKVPLLPIMQRLEAKGAIQIKGQPTQNNRDAPWIVHVKARALDE
jgi:two-component system cell cycle response regulator CtrA